MTTEKPVLNIKTRREIYVHIKDNPGFHKRELSRVLKMPYSTLNYHLKYLIKQNLISKKRNNGYSRYYVKDSIGTEEKNIIDSLRQKIRKNIIFFMMYHFVATEKDLSDHFEKHPTTIKHHLKKLIELNIIEYATVENGEIDNKLPFEGPRIMRRPVKNEKIYRIKDRMIVLKVMTILFDDLLKDEDFRAFHDICTEVKTLCEGIPKKLISFEKAVDDALDNFLDVFPIPWCA